MPKDVSKEKSINKAKTTFELVVCAVIIGTSVFLGKSCFDKVKVVPSTNQQASTIEEIEIPDASDVLDPNKIVFTPTPINTRMKFSGNLVLVNNDYEYFSTGEEKLVSIMEKNDEAGRKSFIAVDYDYTILEPAYEPLAKMVDDWYGIYSNDTLIVYGSHRTKEFQQQLYDQFTANTADDGEAPIVARPGFSEHETGLAIDFSETVNYDYQGDGDFQWLNNNCHKYGFVIRYAEDKEAITEYRKEPWHFRYVGIPHAKYMTENNLCLEEYIELLRNAYNYNGDKSLGNEGYYADFDLFNGDDAFEVQLEQGEKLYVDAHIDKGKAEITFGLKDAEVCERISNIESVDTAFTADEKGRYEVTVKAKHAKGKIDIKLDEQVKDKTIYHNK
jgi:D-alanyl-D-alanine carboxypeptidase